MAHQALIVRPIPAHQAAMALYGLQALDPRGRMTAHDITDLAERGQCFELDGVAQGVYVVNVQDGVVWVDALRARGSVDVTRLLAELLEHQAAGLRAIAFQTARRGLVRKMQRLGYRITHRAGHGWAMRKDLQ